MKKIIDWLLLPKETRNLQKINEIAWKVNDYICWEYLQNLLNDFENIKTKEHKTKITYWTSFIKLIQLKWKK